jgi:transposase
VRRTSLGCAAGEGIAASMYYGWSKEFLEAGKRRLAIALKEVVADLTLENRLLAKA